MKHAHPLYTILKPLARFYAYFFLKYKHHSKYRIRKDETVVVVSNHHTDLDSILINLSFNRLLHTLATDHIFIKGPVSGFLKSLGAVPKRKGLNDVRSVLQIKRLVQSGESILFFPEGNRTYADFQFYITPNMGKFLKMLKATIIIFNINGGFGTYPRWGNKRRTGPFSGEIKKILKYDDYKDMDDVLLTETVKREIKVQDSLSGMHFKSDKKAEYLERMFFVCPKCKTTGTLVSSGSDIYCLSCGMKATLDEELHLSSDSFGFTSLIDWYNLQIEWINKNEFKGLIFEDSGCNLRSGEPFTKHKLIIKSGTLRLTDSELTITDKSGKQISFPVQDIDMASPVSGRILCLTVNGEAYIIRGAERFNPLKYVLLFNKLDTKMKNINSDHYFELSEVTL